MAGEGAGLTPRELEALRWLPSGLPGKCIATRMGVSEKTLGHHLAAVRAKLGVRNAAQAVAEGFRRGLLVGLCALTLVSGFREDVNALRSGRGGQVRVVRVRRSRRREGSG